MTNTAPPSATIQDLPNGPLDRCQICGGDELEHVIDLGHQPPWGLLDPGASPEEAARGELFEETGYRARGALTLLGCLAPDTGRLENRLWGYFAGPRPWAVRRDRGRRGPEAR